MSEFSGRFGERIPSDSTQNAVVIEGAALGGASRGAVVFPDGGKIEAEFGCWGL